jgi:hypothetical protein
MTVSGASATTGTVSVAANGTLSYTPPENFFGSDTINYTVSDGNGGSDSASVTVTVTSVNDAPEATNDTASVAEGSSDNTIGVLANDTDLEGDTLSVTEASASNGSVSVNENGTLSYSPQASLIGTDTITYVVSDGNGGSDTASVTVTVTAVAMPIPTGLTITFTN